MSMLVENASNSLLNLDLEIVKINKRRMTLALFKQLYSEKPFSDDYDLLYTIEGKVFHQGKEFVIFCTPTGIRKFDISKFKKKVGIADLETSLYNCLHSERRCFELGHFASKIHEYYSDKYYENNEDDSYSKETLRRLLRTSPEDGYIERENAKGVLLSLLEGSFKERVGTEYLKGISKINKRNKLSDDLNSAKQVYI